MTSYDYKSLISETKEKFGVLWPKIEDAEVEQALCEEETEEERTIEDVLLVAISVATEKATEKARQEGINEGKQLILRQMTERRGSPQPPKVMPSVSPSSLESNESSKRKYHSEIMDIEINHGAFVLVPAYLAFVKGAYAPGTPKPASDYSRTLFEFASWCPTGRDWEERSSAAIADWLNQELRAECNVSQLDYQVSVIHQAPVVPKTKTKKQVVDIAVFVLKKDKKKALPVAMIEHKVRDSFDSYASQASMYGTDCQNVTGRSVIMIQTRGHSLNSLEMVVYGIMGHWDKQVEHPTHLRSILLQCSGEKGLMQVASGLRAFFPVLLQEKENENNGYVLSAVCARHGRPDGNGTGRVYKSFDYRYRDVDKMRNANLELYRSLVCSTTELVITTDGLAVLSMPYFTIEEGKHQYGPVKGRQLQMVVAKLSSLHSESLVHGDIRLANMLPHHGLLIDFDYTAECGTLYPKGLLNIGWDGERAEEVSQAIEAGTVGELEMQFQHDIDSLFSVLRLYGPTDSSFQTAWDEILSTTSSSLEVFSQELEQFADVDFDVQFAKLGTSTEIANELGTGGTPDFKRTLRTNGTGRKAKKS